ncbi:hypothetical protein DSECCO2_328310 [anaerobic digester metagenome]
MGEQRLGIDQRTADKLRELESAGELTEVRLREAFLSSPVKPLKKVSVSMAPIQKYFPEGTSQGEIVKTIQKALKQYFEASEGSASYHG